MHQVIASRSGAIATAVAALLVAVFTAPLASATTPFDPAAHYHVVRAKVTTDWRYSYTGYDSGNSPISGSGSEIAHLTFARATNAALNPFGIFTARFTGSDTGSYSHTGSGGTGGCSSYTLNAWPIQEQLQLSLVRLSHHRVEVNAALGPGQTSSAVSAFQRELGALQSPCGQIPPQAGQALDYNPAPNNVHTSACRGIAHGCEILPARAFRRRRVIVRIVVNGAKVPAGYSPIPLGASGPDTFSWKIRVVLKRS